MDFQLSDILRVPISYIIKGAYFLVPNYAVALLLFAIIVKLILFPLGIKQQKNMVKQAKLQPRVDAIRKRYAGRTDQATQQKMQQETLDLYQKEGFNPMGGCLPMLIQLPILFSLYNVISNPLKYLCNLSSDAITAITNKINELYVALDAGALTGISIPENFLTSIASGAEKLSGVDKVKAIRYFGESHFSEWLNGVSLPDFHLFGLDLSETPAFSFDSLGAILLFLIPILSGVFSFLSMKLTRKLQPMPQTEESANMNASMKIMDWTMPLMSVWIAFSVPAVIGLYWIYQNILGTVQQFILKKMYPTPVFTEEERRAIEKEMNGKIKKEPVKKSGKKVRSLHHIDDEDFADTAEASHVSSDAPAAQEEAAAKEKKKSPVADMIAPAKMKSDDSASEKKTSETDAKEDGEE